MEVVGCLKAGALAFEEAAVLVEESAIQETIDLGHAMLYKLSHPAQGPLVVLCSAVGASGVVPV